MKIVLSFCTFLTAVSPGLADNLSDSPNALAEQFLSAVVDGSGSNPQGVVKWPLSKVDAAFIYGNPDDLEIINEHIRPIFEDTFEKIQRRTGVRYNLTDETDPHRDVRIFISVGPPRSLLPIAQHLERRLDFSGYVDAITNSLEAGRSACAISYGWSASSNLTRVLISVDTDAQIKKCINMRLVQSVGLINPPELGTNSVMSPASELAEVTDVDELLMRVLYSPEIKSGSTPQRGTVEFLISELLAEG